MIVILNYFTKRSKRQPVKLMKYQHPCFQESERNQNYSILQYVEGNTKPTGEAYHPENAFDNFKQIYFEALDAIVNAINDRFDQPAFELFS